MNTILEFVTWTTEYTWQHVQFFENSIDFRTKQEQKNLNRTFPEIHINFLKTWTFIKKYEHFLSCEQFFKFDYVLKIQKNFRKCVSLMPTLLSIFAHIAKTKYFSNLEHLSNVFLLLIFLENNKKIFGKMGIFFKFWKIIGITKNPNIFWIGTHFLIRNFLRIFK